MLFRSNISIAVGDTLTVNGQNTIVVYTANSKEIRVSPAITGNLVANTVYVTKAQYNQYGNVTIFNPVISIAVNNSGFVIGDNVFLQFLSSDTSLTNTWYTAQTANSKYLKVFHRTIANAVSLTGNVNVYTKNVMVSYANHGYANGDNVYLAFGSGDTMLIGRAHV